MALLQLAEQIPTKLREDLERYKRQIADVKMRLHNSYARFLPTKWPVLTVGVQRSTPPQRAYPRVGSRRAAEAAPPPCHRRCRRRRRLCSIDERNVDGRQRARHRGKPWHPHAAVNHRRLDGAPRREQVVGDHADGRFTARGRRRPPVARGPARAPGARPDDGVPRAELSCYGNGALGGALLMRRFW